MLCAVCVCVLLNAVNCLGWAACCSLVGLCWDPSFCSSSAMETFLPYLFLREKTCFHSEPLDTTRVPPWPLLVGPARVNDQTKECGWRKCYKVEILLARKFPPAQQVFKINRATVTQDRITQRCKIHHWLLQRRAAWHQNLTPPRVLSDLATDLHYISIQTSAGFVLQVIPLFKTCTRLNPGCEAELQFLHKIWWPSYPLGGFYKNSQVLIFLCSSSLQHECIHISSAWEPSHEHCLLQDARIAEVCLVPSCPCICSAADHPCFCSSDTSASV